MTAQDVLQLSPLILAVLIPSILIIANIFVSEESPFRVPAFVTSLTAGLSGLAVVLQSVVSLLGYPVGASRIYGLVQLDLVSSAMLVLVCTLAVVVVRYSRTYLAGEAGLDRYARSMLATIASVTVLVISNHLGFLIAGWVLTGIFLHQLLIFYRTRRQAVIVAHKKFLLGRVADFCFVGSLGVMSAEVGTLRIDELNALAAKTNGALSPPLQLATVLLVLGVLLKTAQLPFHGWMLQVMEAPTPVSALLHAGVVNIGGFVMIRLSPLMAHAVLAQDILLGVGLVTALVGSLVMMTRMSIKLVLAWSTIAQMGFMLVQCGLGVWHLALLHLLAHSFYKAHSFLTSGSVVETWRGTSLVRGRKPFWSTAVAIVLLGAVGSGLYALSLRASVACARAGAQLRAADRQRGRRGSRLVRPRPLVDARSHGRVFRRPRDIRGPAPPRGAGVEPCARFALVGGGSRARRALPGADHLASRPQWLPGAGPSTLRPQRSLPR
jgi:NADH:ubiquinone oxidoreductase subunit 5 (subunit L)/multisubunit Na+/H+ antiporter MnhA subunit